MVETEKIRSGRGENTPGVEIALSVDEVEEDRQRTNANQLQSTASKPSGSQVSQPFSVRDLTPPNLLNLNEKALKSLLLYRLNQPAISKF